MRTTLIVVALLVSAIAAFVVWRLWATYAGGRRAYLRFAERIASVEAALVEGRDPAPADLERFARNRETRKVLYDALDHHKKLELFPAAYRTAEAMAEGDLVLWLAHPNELGSPPSEIELMAKVPAAGQDFLGQYYFVFRYRMHSPHWAAKDGWLAGVAGPYLPDGQAPGSVSGTFSRFEAFESRTPEEHVEVTHSLVIDGR